MASHHSHSGFAGGAMGSETVLVCEDDEGVRQLIERILSGAGYTVLPMPGPRQALELVARRGVEFDLLMSDFDMPEMSGPQLAGELGTVERGIPVLLVSGHPADALRERAELPDGCEHVAKPFDRATLLAKVREVLDRAPPAAAAG